MNEEEHFRQASSIRPLAAPYFRLRPAQSPMLGATATNGPTRASAWDLAGAAAEQPVNRMAIIGPRYAESRRPLPGCTPVRSLEGDAAAGSR